LATEKSRGRTTVKFDSPARSARTEVYRAGPEVRQLDVWTLLQRRPTGLGSETGRKTAVTTTASRKKSWIADQPRSKVAEEMETQVTRRTRRTRRVAFAAVEGQTSPKKSRHAPERTAIAKSTDEEDPPGTPEEARKIIKHEFATTVKSFGHETFDLHRRAWRRVVEEDYIPEKYHRQLMGRLFEGPVKRIFEQTVGGGATCAATIWTTMGGVVWNNNHKAAQRSRVFQTTPPIVVHMVAAHVAPPLC
jgi:hypothetical protein